MDIFLIIYTIIPVVLVTLTIYLIFSDIGNEEDPCDPHVEELEEILLMMSADEIDGMDDYIGDNDVIYN
jgi:hypothetical protein